MYNLCCMSNELKPAHSMTSMTWRNYAARRDVGVLSNRWFNNVDVTYHTIEHCHKNGWGYRVSSSIFPVLTHPEFDHAKENTPCWDRIKLRLEQIKQANSEWQVRLSMHPDQFNVLASTNEQAVDKTIKELNLHGWLMDVLGCERSRKNPINIHINCCEGDLSSIAARFASNLRRCDQSVVSRLVVENEDKGVWNVRALLDHIAPLGIPITFDNLHHACNTSLDQADAMLQCAATWSGIKPVFHYSESDPGSRNIRSHAAMPSSRPAQFDCDWDIELKNKDAAIRSIMQFVSNEEMCDTHVAP
jgi:UV DNA damage endonuclease